MCNVLEEEAARFLPNFCTLPSNKMASHSLQT